MPLPTRCCECWRDRDGAQIETSALSADANAPETCVPAGGSGVPGIHAWWELGGTSREAEYWFEGVDPLRREDRKVGYVPAVRFVT